MDVIKVNSENFAEEVLNSNVPVLVDFWADWCTPCKMMAPVLEKISEEKGEEIKVCKINVDENRDLAIEYNVMSIPAFFVFKNGNIVASTVGVQDKDDLLNLLK